MMLDEPAYHVLGCRPTDYPASGVQEVGIGVEARTSYVEVLALHAERRARMRGVVDALPDSELEQIRAAVPAPEWGTQSQSPTTGHA